eukprot:s2242_g6.t1
MLKDILKLVSAAEQSEAESESDGPDGGPEAGPDSGAEVEETTQASAADGQHSTGELGHEGVAGSEGAAPDEAASAAEFGHEGAVNLAADPVVDPSAVDTQVPTEIMQHGEEHSSCEPPVMMHVNKKKRARPPVPAFETDLATISPMEVPLNESAPTLEAAPEAEVPATMSPMEVPPESAPIDIAAEVPATQSSPVEEVPPESAPIEVAAEVPATQSSPVEVPPESLPIEVAAEVPATQLEVPPAAEEPLIINRPQWDTDAAMAKIRAEAMISTEEEYEKLPELQSKLRLSLISSDFLCVSEVRKLEAGTAFFDVWRYFETEKKALLREQTAAMLRVQPHEPESADSEV